jgi:beta-glucanase (GH16 family)
MTHQIILNNARARISKTIFPARAAGVFAAIIALLFAGELHAATQWNIVWNDEFNGPAINTSNWVFETGGGGWGNNELENYTSRTNNARIVNGQLVIEADQESYGGNNYTSARMKTQGKWSWTYGRIEGRIKIPRGQGIWPAFWMLGTDIVPAGWPTCGEIDIMENIGKTSDQGTEHGTIHGPQTPGVDYNYYAGVSGTYTLPGGAALADDFHIFTVEWTTNQIQWFLDSHQFFAATPASLPEGATWVFTQPQFLVLNVAVGGNWPGNPDGTTSFPQQMVVDYVRVYQQTAPLQISATQSNGNVVLTWPANIVCHLQAQTNSLVDGNWSDISNVTNPLHVSPDPNNASVFFRLESP